MRISVQTGGVMERVSSPDECFALLHDCGFEAADFGLDPVFSRGNGLNSLEERRVASEDVLFAAAEPYRRAAKQHGIALTQTHALFPTFLPDDEGYNAFVLEVLKRSIAVTGYLGAKNIVVHPGFARDNHTRHGRETEWEINRRLYTALIPALKESGVTCCLENMFTRGPEGMRYAAVCSNFSDAALWVDQLNDITGEALFAFCFDTGHCHLTCQNQRYALNCLGKRIHALHIHDNDGHTDWHVAPYMGTTDWDDFLAGLRDIGYDHDLSFETFNVLNRYPTPLHPEALRAIAATGAYFRKQIQG